MKKQKQAFVIIPFDPEFETIYHDLLVPSLEASGFEVSRADSMLDQRNILKDIIRGIDSADLIIAELTSLNANVMYELGIAHGLEKPTILLAQSIEDVPFDLRSYRVIPYSTHFKEVGALQEKIQKIATSLIEETASFENPVTDFRVPSLEIPTPVEPTVDEHGEPAVQEEQEELGMLDFVIEGKKAITDVGTHMSELTNIAGALTEKMTVKTQDIETLQAARLPGNTAKLYLLAQGIAKDMMEFSVQIDSKHPGFLNAWDRLAENTTGAISGVHVSSAADKQSLQNLRTQTQKFKDTIGTVIESVKGTKNVFSGLKGVSKDLNRATKRLLRSYDQLIDTLTIGESYLSRLIVLIDEKLND